MNADNDNQSKDSQGNFAERKNTGGCSGGLSTSFRISNGKGAGVGLRFLISHSLGEHPNHPRTHKVTLVVVCCCSYLLLLLFVVGVVIVVIVVVMVVVVIYW